MVFKIERLRSGADDGRRTLSLFIRPGSRRRPWKFFSPEEVPAFVGEYAWFEIDRAHGGWKFLRQLPGPTARH
ncbi:hypothetical protein DJ017_10420 [Phenylobacterium soli]|uniref:Uncharacterized protein n=2 Tax=Phenylobacterium soli TaxID=2170551 RepID=A0A328AJ84_9CAUL|nr:hypothetical protein DJ017_10420 [Phenylobacterium soli]